MLAGRVLSRFHGLLIPLFVLSLIVSLYFSTPFFIIQNIGVTLSSILFALIGLSFRWRATVADGDDIARSSVQDGVYSTVRFPTLLSDLMFIVALSLFSGVLSFIFLAIPISYLFIDRIILWREYQMESEVPEAFAGWAESTTALIPMKRISKPTQYRPPFRYRVSKIAPALLLLTAGYAIVDGMKSYMTSFELYPNPYTLAPLALTLLLFISTIGARR